MNVRRIALIVALTGACYRPIERGPSESPLPGGVEVIKQAAFPDPNNQPGRAWIHYKITYANNYDYAMETGYYAGTVGPPDPGYSWTNRQWINGPVPHEYVCPKIWLYVQSHIGHVMYELQDNLPATKITYQQGTWGNPQENANPRFWQQPYTCEYNYGWHGANCDSTGCPQGIPIDVGSVHYDIFIGRSCTLWGGYSPSGDSTLVQIYDQPNSNNVGGNASWYLSNYGPYTDMATWRYVSGGCTYGPAMPPSGTGLGMVTCVGQFGSTCVAWASSGFSVP